MKIYSIIEDLKIESFKELKAFNDKIANEVSIALCDEKPTFELLWKNKAYTISLDSMDFIIGYNYGSICAFVEMEKDEILKNKKDQSETD